MLLCVYYKSPNFMLTCPHLPIFVLSTFPLILPPIGLFTNFLNPLFSHLWVTVCISSYPFFQSLSQCQLLLSSPMSILPHVISSLMFPEHTVFYTSDSQTLTCIWTTWSGFWALQFKKLEHCHMLLVWEDSTVWAANSHILSSHQLENNYLKKKVSYPHLCNYHSME